MRGRVIGGTKSHNKAVEPVHSTTRRQPHPPPKVTVGFTKKGPTMYQSNELSLSTRPTSSPKTRLLIDRSTQTKGSPKTRLLIDRSTQTKFSTVEFKDPSSQENDYVTRDCVLVSKVKASPRKAEPVSTLVEGVSRNAEEPQKKTAPSDGTTENRVMTPEVKVSLQEAKSVCISEEGDSGNAEEPQGKTAPSDSTTEGKIMTSGVKVSPKVTEAKRQSGKAVSCSVEEPQKRATQSDGTAENRIMTSEKKVTLQKAKPVSVSEEGDSCDAEEPQRKTAPSDSTTEDEAVTPEVEKVEPKRKAEKSVSCKAGEPQKSATQSEGTTEDKRCWAFQLTKFHTLNPSNLPQNLQFVSDSDTNVIFLVDSGSEISILSKELTNGVNRYFPPQKVTIQGFGGKAIHPIGSVEVQLKLGELELINHSFWVTQEPRSYGIIGLDLLRKHKLAIFPSSGRLSSTTSKKSAKLFTAADVPTPVVALINNIELVREGNSLLEEKCRKLLLNFPEITANPTYGSKPKHDHELELILDDYKPVMVSPRRAGGRRAAIDAHFKDLENRGVVVQGVGYHGASPVTCVLKKDKTMRVCVDYTRLNAATRPLCYPLPRIDDLSSEIPGGVKYFTNLDLKEAYYSLPLAANSRKWAAVIIHAGVFIPRRCIFGLKNAPMRFQQMMETLLKECREYTYIYLDDILIFSYTEQEHLFHVGEVFKVLAKNGLFLNVKKSVFAKSKVEFLGHIVGVNGIDVQSAKVAAIRNYPMPITRKDLRRFLGLVNYYHKFVERLSDITAPLSEISGGPKRTNRSILNLTDAQIQAFEDTKMALANATSLSFENRDKPLMLYSDASDTHVGAVLEQEGDNAEERKPLAFFSRSIPVPKRIRSIYHKELKGLVLSIKHFHNRIYGRQLIIRCDNLALCNALKNNVTDQPPIVQRYLQKVKDYDPEIIHIKGIDNVVADALSRPPQMTTNFVSRCGTDPDYVEEWESDSEEEEQEDELEEIEEEIIRAGQIDRSSVALLQQNEGDLVETARKLKKEVKYSEPDNVAEIVEVGNSRIILPEQLRLPAFNAAHRILHLGIEKSIEAVAKDFWWPTLKEDVTKWVNTCIDCQAIKVVRHNRPKIGFFPERTQRLNFVHIDLVGPMDVVSNNCKYVLTIKDRGTGFLVATPIPDKKALTVRDAFVQSWCSYFGTPQVVVSDNGREFVNQVLTDTFTQLGVDHRLVPPYSPQANGYIERQHKTINQALRAVRTKENWALRLPIIIASINNTSIEGSPYTPSQYALGMCANLPGQIFLNNSVESNFECNPLDAMLFLNIMANVNRKNQRYTERKEYYEPSLFQCEKVWVRRTNKRKLSTLFHGPYRVVQATEHSMYIEKNGKVVKVSIRNVKAYREREDTEHSGSVGKVRDGYNLRDRKTVVNYEEESSSDE